MLNKLGFLRNRLIWKIILIFWLTTIATIIANVVITKELVLVEYKIDQLRGKMLALTKESVALYEQDGPEALRRWLKDLRQTEKIRVVLLNEEGYPIVLPSRRHRHHDEDDDFHENDEHDHDHDHEHEHRWLNQATGKPRERGFPERFLDALDQNIVTASGRSYTLRMLPSRYLKQHFASPETLHGSRLLASFIIIFLGSWWLARSVSRPVNVLRRASEQMAQGHLEQRVSSEIGTRKDELGQLAHAFDHMAEKIEDLLESQRQLFSDISHEIRTPLTRQKIAIELARSDENTGIYLDKIEQQNQAIEHLVDQLLTMIRLDSKQAASEHVAALDLGRLVEEVVQSAELDAQAKGIAITTQLPEPMALSGNPDLIKRAIENLVMNAIKYSPNNSLIEIHATEVPEGLSLAICDQGPGIPENELSRALEPFYRTDKSRTQSTGGYGLGLAIVQRIVQQHHGSIELSNRTEGGLQATLIFEQAT